MLDFSCSVYGFGRSVGAHGQGETLSFQVNVQYPYLYHIADLYRFKRMLDKSVAYLGDVNETVTAKDVINLRSTPYTGDEGNVVGQLKNGETLVRTGRNDSTGWSRLEYNGQTVYAVTAYLTTDLAYKTPEKPSNPNRVSTQDGRVIVFVDCDDYITPKDLINLRTEPSTSEGESTVRTQVRNGTNLHRTGYSEASGWSRVEYLSLIHISEPTRH